MRSRLLEEVILKSWWAILTFLTIFFIFDQASFRREKEKKQLQKKHELLVKRREQALSLQRQLEKKIASQQDPRWIELTLMHKLGLIPEEQTKILFEQVPASGLKKNNASFNEQPELLR